MSLWIDKHRPSNLSKLTYHTEQAQNLRKLVRQYFHFHVKQIKV